MNVQDETITEDTECWICHRKVREVLDKVLDIWGSGDEGEDYSLCMEKLEIGGVPVHICFICHMVMQRILEEVLIDCLGIESIREIVTIEDLKKARIVID